MNKTFLEAKLDAELQAECDSVFENYDELTDGVLIVSNNKAAEVCHSFSEEHSVYRVDVYELDEQFTDLKMSADVLKDAVSEDSFYLVEKTQVEQFTIDFLSSAL